MMHSSTGTTSGSKSPVPAPAPGPRSSKGLLKAETVALWHAVSNYELMIKQMNGMEGITPEQIEAERRRLDLAKRCLKKVNALRHQGL
jgi:hypothetical protein